MGLRQQFTLPHLSEWIPSPFQAHSEFMQSHEGV
jgi:hypothetical protein